MSKLKNEQVNITPDEARKIAQNSLPEIKLKWLNCVRESIKFAAECGKMYAEVYAGNEEERQYVAKELRKAGFKVKIKVEKVKSTARYLIIDWK